jgi:exodeoxyribonuclease V
MKLTDDQEQACDIAMDWLTDPAEKFLIIQGSAGTGKSTLVREFLERVKLKADLLASILGSKDGIHEWGVNMMATTNKAAGVLAEMADMEVVTVHSFLKLIPWTDYVTGELHFKQRNDYEPVFNQLLLVDEGSFLSDELIKKLDQSTIRCKIIIVGDQYQLAPPPKKALPGEEVDPNEPPPKPVMESLVCPRATLSKIVRHDSEIAQLGAQCRSFVKTGKFTWMTMNGNDIVHMDPIACLNTVDDVFTHPDYNMDTVRILAYSNKKVIQHNTYVRTKRGMHPLVEVGETLLTNKPISDKHGVFASTDTRVTVNHISEEVVKDDVKGVMIGFTKSDTMFFLPYDQNEVASLKRTLKKAGNIYGLVHIRDTWLDIRPVFASTVHKSQGSTFNTVFIDLSDIGKCHNPDMTARMLYVATTRASHKVIFFGKLPPWYGGIIHAQLSHAA